VNRLHATNAFNSFRVDAVANATCSIFHPFTSLFLLMSTEDPSLSVCTVVILMIFYVHTYEYMEDEVYLGNIIQIMVNP
jgi:hypothetical protein